MTTHGTRVVILNNLDEIAEFAANIIVELARESIENRDKFCIALSGGGTPGKLHQLLSTEQFRAAIDWTRVVVFWGDERFVAPDHPDRNERMARETLLDAVPIPESNIFAVAFGGDVVDVSAAHRAAAAYEEAIVQTLGAEARFDLVLLGLGEDGHTASLFPDQIGAGHVLSIEPGGPLVVAVTSSPKPPPVRVTLTYEILNRARNVLFLVSGAGKGPALRRVLSANVSVGELPAVGVAPADGQLTWLVDYEAYTS